ncbi:TOP3A, partial [Symbiodinium necroappetens]
MTFCRQSLVALCFGGPQVSAMSMFDDDLGQELQTEEAVKPKSSLKPRRGSRRQSRRVSQAGVDAAVAAAVGEKSEATGDNIGKALSKITGQAKALKFAMDLAQKAYDARDEEEDDDFHVDCEESDEYDPDGQRQDSEVEKLRQRAKSEPAAKEELEMAELFTNLESPTFQPAPLHVRGLCQGAKRACERSLAVEEQRLAVAEMLGQTLGGESPKNVECLTDEEQQNLDVTRKRLRYNVDLLRRRRQRLANIDNKTFQQLPEPNLHPLGVEEVVIRAAGWLAFRVLNVAEKPSVAREITSQLGGGGVSRRNSHGIPVTEFPFTLRQTQCRMVVTAVRGHLLETQFPPEYSVWKAHNPSILFQVPVQRKAPADNKNLELMLTDLARQCQWLVLWLDCDREGEAIAFEVLETCQRAAGGRLQVFRAVFSALTRQDLVRACQTLRDPDQRLADAVEARQHFDLRAGSAFTRWMSLRYQNMFPELCQQPLSYGPCQFPTLGFVVERFLRIQRFVSEPFWSIKAEVQKDGHSVRFNWRRGRLFDRLAVLALYELVVEE